MRRSIGTALVALAFGCRDAPTAVDVTGVRINGPTTLRFESIREEARLTATVTGRDSALAVQWSSTQPAVATVNAGLVTAAGNGQATIIASAGLAADSVSVTVEQVTRRLLFVDQPDHAVRGESFREPVRIAVADALGTPVRLAASTITVSLDAGANAGTLSGTTRRPTADGVATFDDLAVSATGAGYRLTATGIGRDGPITVSSIAFDVVPVPDLVFARNTTSAPSGFLIDGRGANGPIDDLGLVATDSVVKVVLDAGTSTNEVIAFTRTRPPVLVPAPWTAGPDTVMVSFPDPIAIALTVWIVKGPFAQQQQRAADAVATTAGIWTEERMGVGFSQVEFIDATADPDAPPLYDQTLCNQQAQTVASIGRQPGRINVYYVGNVDGGTGRGRACGRDFIVMAERSGLELLSHEIGHSFSLGHVDNDPLFDQSNVMHSASTRRQFLTEGQLFRSHYNSTSALRSVYGARTGPPRDCPDGIASPSCPRLARRLWADGIFPPAGAAPTASQQVGAAAIVSRWLLSSCGVGDEAVTAAALQALGEPASDALLEAFDAPPDPAVERDIVRAAADRFAQSRAWIRQAARAGLTDATRAALLAVDPSTYVGSALDDFTFQLRSQALRGLGIVGGQRAIVRLQQIAMDTTSPLATVARRALERRAPLK